ncbi:MAG: DUF2804 domain-containing protein [Proteobacteria bacterium]|nr:DUF2804 domain-containing protein [Pseudomonadota bacterium]
MQNKMGAGPLLDSQGRLLERGWATSEVRRYRRAAVKAWPLRTKEWDYYCVLTDEYGIALTVADNDYLGFLGVTWLDFSARTSVSQDVITPFPRGKFGMPESADAGDVVQEHPKLKLAFRHVEGGRRLSVEAGFAKGRGLSGEIFLAQPSMHRMVIATPFANAPRSFYYNQKINCLRAEGEIKIGEDRFAFTPDRAFGVLDWGRGAWTYDNTWYWGSASGLIDGEPFGFNIGYGFGDTSVASENMLIVSGAAHKLDAVTFHMPDGPPDSAPWRFTSNDGRFEMRFEPVLDRASKTDLGLLLSDQHQVFGRFSGEVVLDGGRKLFVENLIGFAEKVHNRW